MRMQRWTNVSTTYRFSEAKPAIPVSYQMRVFFKGQGSHQNTVGGKDRLLSINALEQPIAFANSAGDMARTATGLLPSATGVVVIKVAPADCQSRARSKPSGNPTKGLTRRKLLWLPNLLPCCSLKVSTLTTPPAIAKL